MRVCAAWKIDSLFEQLDEDTSGSLDEHELFKLMQVAAEQPFPKTATSCVPNPNSLTLHRGESESTRVGLRRMGLACDARMSASSR